MPKYLIPVKYSMFGNVEIEADSLLEALELAESNIDELPLPESPKYVDGSYEINHDPLNLALINNIQYSKCIYYQNGSCSGEKGCPSCYPIDCESMKIGEKD